MQTQTIVRHWPLTGPGNFRDLGGYETAAGLHTRWRRLFRSDSLHHLTEEDIGRLESEGLRIALGIDLRTAKELETTGHGEVFGRGPRHLHLPFVAAVQPSDPEQRIEDIDRLYMHMLEGAHDCVKAVFEALADEANYPLVYYCAAGKDRTGMISALVLAALGVREVDIVADYSLTDEHMSGVLSARFEQARKVREAREATQRASADAPHEQSAQPAHGLSPAMLRAKPETMRTFLGALKHQYGSAYAYLLTSGVTPSLLEAVRAQLLA